VEVPASGNGNARTLPACVRTFAEVMNRQHAPALSRLPRRSL
jgi:hypothetical protein